MPTLDQMDLWDLALGAMAGYIAVVTLVRLMAGHRDRLVTRFRAEVEQERQLRLDRERKRNESAARAPVAKNKPAA